MTRFEGVQTGANESNEMKASTRLLEDVYQAVTHPEKSLQQAQLLGNGLVGGVTKEINADPGKAVKGVCEALVGGAVIGAGIGLLAAEAPFWGAAVAGGATVLGVKWVWDKFDPNAASNQERNRNIKSAMDALWKSDDRNAFRTNLPIVEQNLGKDALDLSTGLLGGVTAGSAFRVAPRAWSSFKSSEPMARLEFAMLDKSVWRSRPDGTKVASRPSGIGEIVRHPDGKSVETIGNSTYTKFRNGNRMNEYESGGREFRTKDGVEIRLPNGEKRMRKFGSSDVRIEKPDGTVIEKGLSVRTETKPDGTRIRTDELYGSKNVRYPDGSDVHTNPDGSKVFKSKEGFVTEYPDGRRSVLTDKGRIYEDGRGNQFHLTDFDKKRSWHFETKEMAKQKMRETHLKNMRDSIEKGELVSFELADFDP